MTKLPKLDTATIVPAAPASSSRPYAINVFGPTTHVLQQVGVHCRQGYIVDLNSAVEVFAAAGTMSLVMVLGDAEQCYVVAAETTVSDAVAIEQARFDASVQLAAERIVANAKRAAANAARTAMISEQKAALAALEKQLAADAAAEAVASE